MTSELAQISDWVKASKISPIIRKIHYIMLSVGNDLNIGIDNRKISPVLETHFWGAVVDSKSSWKEHIS